MIMIMRKYMKLCSLLGFLLFFVILFSACSDPTPITNPVNTNAMENELPTTHTLTIATSTPVSQVTIVPSGLTLTPSPVEDPTAIPSPTQTVFKTPLPSIGSTRISEVDQMEQVYVPAGEFLMGSVDPEAKQVIEGGRAYPEIPQHTVYLHAYWIDKYEVTNAQYALCEEAGVCEPPWSPGNYTYPKYYGQPEFSNYPIVWVSWFQARQYCEWAGRRLPTEAEWEKAARGTDGQKYPWGDEPVTGERANFCDINCTRTIANAKFDDGYPDTAPVGSYPAGSSPYGAMDMSGNVWEWVSTLIQPYPYDPNDGREDLDATGERAWRGGPWSNGIWWMRSSVRYRSVDFYKWYVLGIRCASSE
jgi:formylglycine-generating enzyme required for sulfatase activity